MKELYATALRCGRPGCMQALYRISDTGARVLNSQVAHIHARRETGPRWNSAMTEEENRSYGNLIVLCYSHASEIDLTPEHFPAEMLREWKRVQVATQERAAKSQPPLTDVEAGDVIRRSFGFHDLAAAVAAAVPFSARSRSRDEALDLAVRQSLARRTTRLLAVPADRQDAVLSWMSEQDDPVVEVPEGWVRVLIAPMGAGKSERASRWWDEGLSAAQADAGTEIPVWLDARRVTAGLDTAVAGCIGRDPVRPCRVVIDNLDGVSPGEAGQLLDEARNLVRTWPRMRVLVTSRPGVAVGGDEVIGIEPWPAERGIDLVRVITGNAGWHSWTVETAGLLTSPLTAIAVAARLLKGRDVRVSRLTLLRDLAQTIVEQKRPDRATPELWDELARLASRILSAPAAVTAASFGNEAQVWQLTDTGLVVNDGGALRFDSHDIRWIYAQLQRETGEQLCPPWPAPDQPRPWARWLWQGYSPELAHPILTEILSAAVTGYRDLVAENFPGFGWALGLNSILPVQVEGTLVHQDGSDGEYSSLHYQLIPGRAAGREAVSQVHLDLVTQPGARWPGARVLASPYDRRRNPFYVPTGHTIPPPTGQSRPATNLAYQWLAADLLTLGWLDHTVAFHD